MTWQHRYRSAAGSLSRDIPPEASWPVSVDDREWLRKQLHSPEMQCRQCDLTRALLDEGEVVLHLSRSIRAGGREASEE